MALFVDWLIIGVYGISTAIGNLMPNPVYTYVSNMYDL